MADKNRKNGLEDSLQSVSFFKTLLQASPDGILITDSSMNIIATNEAFCSIVNKKNSDVIETSIYNWLNVFDGNAREKWAELIKIVNEKSFCRNYEFSKTSDKGVQYYNVYAFLFKNDADGEKGIIISSWHDTTERKRADDVLREREAKYRMLAENITDVIWHRDMDLNFTYISPSIRRQSGFSVEEKIKQSFEDGMTRDSAAISFRILSEELELEMEGNGDPERSRTIELELYRKDGSTYTIESSISFFRDDSGKAIGIIGIDRDITERKRTEEKLFKSEKFQRTLIETSPDAIVVLDAELKIKSVNRLQNVTQEDVMGQKVNIFIPPEYHDAFEKTFRLAIDTGQLQIVETAIDYPDGRHYFLNRLNPVSLDDEEKSVVLISTDITERKRADEELRESEKKYRLLSENSKDMIFSLSLPEMKYEYVSPSSVDIIGYTPREIMNEPQFIMKSIHPDWKNWIKGKLNNLLAGIAVDRVEYQLIKKSGETIWVLQSNSLVADDNGNPVALEGRLIDITERKNLENELYKKNMQLEVLSNTDALTKIANRRHFDAIIKHECKRLSRHKSTLSLILCDIDYFKRFNDTYGHQAGDECLAKVAETLRLSASREADYAARYGGEEFAIILPDTDIENAALIAEKMRVSIEELKIPHESSMVNEVLTMSFGVTSLSSGKNYKNNESILIAKADECLYEAKSSGRNRVVKAKIT